MVRNNCRTSMRIFARHIPTLVLLTLVAPFGYAQSDMDDLKARVALLEQKLEATQKELIELRASKGSAPVTNVATAPPATSVEVATTNTKAPIPPPPQIPSVLQSRRTVEQNEYSIARANNAPIDPKLKGFFTLPGTETMMRFGGYVKLDFMYDLRYAGIPDYYQPSSFPQAAPYNSPSTNLNIRQTRLTYEIRRDVGGSPLRFYVESDFYGVNGNAFHLRHAYAQWRNVLAGQTWSLFDDMDTFPDSLEFNGPVSIPLSRNPQVRYSLARGRGRTLSFSAEKPSPDVQTVVANTTITPTSLTPDFVLQYRQENEHGHFQAAAIFRSVGGFVPDIGVRHVLGTGVTLSTVLKTSGSDNFAFQGTIGRGISNTILDQEGQQLDAGINLEGHVDATPAGGFHVAYQHHWSPKWRSSAVYSYARANNLASDPESFYHASHYMLGNLLWSPPDQPLTIGGEFIYGWLVRKDLSTYDAPRIQLGVQYDFVK